MKLQTLILFLFPLSVVGQKDSTVSKKLDTLINYAINYISTSGSNGESYQINDKSVSKKEFYYYKNNFPFNVPKCRPCYLKTYDINGILLYEGEQFTDCPIGSFKDYYPNGKVKISGFYREIKVSAETGWKCSVPDGLWSYYDENGNLQKNEKYVNGIKVN